jgi:2-polyprenyl-6-methoxyphenol hydroxylase-like FAD-dependent oxidoreductase
MRVAVIGRGICGLTFAAAMRRFNADVDVQLYERDAAPESRFQGYSLGMKVTPGFPCCGSWVCSTPCGPT